jgi:multimeric flavodoxin WrbA
MRIVVLNGSPKGRQSVTMQYVEYLVRKFPQVEFEILDVAQKIQGLERDETRFQKVIEAVRTSDGVLWAFPLYILLVPSQYKRFIELIEKRGATDAFAGRYAATLSTSINFFDTTAHNYMRSVCEDLGMRYAGSYSANMQDMMKPAERVRLEGFTEDLFETIRRLAPTPRLYAPLVSGDRELFLSAPERTVAADGLKIVVLTDALPEQRNLQAMVDRFAAAFTQPVELYNLHDLDIRGGCQGCLRCGAEYHCAYTGKDGLIDFYNETLRQADVIVFAGAITARQLSWKWRQFLDRSFFNTHTPSLVGKQIAFLVSGPLSQIPDLRLVYEAWFEIQRSHLAGFVSDEGESAEVTAHLDALAERLVRLARTGYIRPRTFLGIAGMKVFRDDIWGGLRIVFRADHKAYKKLGVYDFPQRSWLRRIAVSLGWLITGLPGIRKRFPAMIKSQMIRPYARLLDRVESPVKA